MIVKWDKPNKKVGLRTVPILEKGKIVENYFLLPGNNDVPNDKWEKMKKNLKDEIERGWIEEVVEEVKVEKKNTIVRNTRKGEVETVETTEESEWVSDFKKLSPKKAGEVVENTFNLDTLNKWLEEEGRESVRAKIIKQIETVNAPPGPRN